MKKLGISAFILAFYGLHQDYWNWREVGPLAFGFLPVGLWYHAIYTLACSGLMWVLIQVAWPSHLEKTVDPKGEKDR